MAALTAGELASLESAAERAGLSVDHYVWGTRRGFVPRAPNRLVITKVHQHDQAVAVLRCAFDARYIRAELQRVGPTPLRLELDWPQTALLIEQLQHCDAFDYEVNP
jgi:hypothetical protein